jgi:type IV secretion system protein TrbD
MNPLRRVPFLRVLWRIQTFCGAERELGLFVTSLCVMLPIWSLTWAALVISAVLWAVALPVLRWLYKVDPQFSAVYRRHLKYRRFYPARSRPYRTFS